MHKYTFQLTDYTEYGSPDPKYLEAYCKTAEAASALVAHLKDLGLEHVTDETEGKFPNMVHARVSDEEIELVKKAGHRITHAQIKIDRIQPNQTLKLVPRAM